MKEMLRVGKECIVTIPNFGQIFCRPIYFSQGLCQLHNIFRITGTTLLTFIYALSKISSLSETTSQNTDAETIR